MLTVSSVASDGKNSPRYGQWKAHVSSFPVYQQQLINDTEMHQMDSRLRDMARCWYRMCTMFCKPSAIMLFSWRLPSSRLIPFPLIVLPDPVVVTYAFES